ncbi:Suppressor of RPS4-RLD 1 [Camellia lanceoleosa]|uniref:Suppressor of RPS4-RLD 1 n=1 Tax=Camellia lanceoleosa TaxID=1840588 RepID=A0ACC0G854_9ERIC|nr:Suppressor of RPS4-RLD 1 [Camellia lanceoleosa]
MKAIVTLLELTRSNESSSQRLLPSTTLRTGGSSIVKTSGSQLTSVPSTSKNATGIVNFKFKDFHAAIEDLYASIKLDKDNKSAYTYLGLALSSIGEYRRAEEAHN